MFSDNPSWICVGFFVENADDKTGFHLKIEVIIDNKIVYIL